MPYQLSWQSVIKNCETPVQVAGSVGASSGGALVTRSTSAASAPLGPDKIPAAKIATAITLFHISNSPPRKQNPPTTIDNGHSRAGRRSRASVPIRPARHLRSGAKYGGTKISSQDRVETNWLHKYPKFTGFIEYLYSGSCSQGARH